MRIWLLFSILAIATADPMREKVDEEYATEVCEGLGLGIFKSSEYEWCCYCAPGYYMSQSCKSAETVVHHEPESRICLPCPFNADDPDNQTYTETLNNFTRCFNSYGQSHCDSYLNTHRVAGSTTRNSGCECNAGYHAANTVNTTDGCHEHSPCKEGFEPSKLADKRSDTHCRACPEQRFSNESSSSAMCVPFTKCENGQVIIKPGNKTHDIVCGTEPPVLSSVLTPTPASYGGSDNTVVIVVVIVAVLTIAALTIVAVIYYCRRKKKICFTTAAGPSQQQSLGVPLLPPGSQPNELPNGHVGEIAETSLQTTSDPERLQSPPINKEDYKYFAKEDDLENAIKKGCMDCCIRKQLHKNDHLAKKMMESLSESDTEDLLSFLRDNQFLDSSKDGQKVRDIKKEERTEQERRDKIILYVCAKYGRELTPIIIFKKEFKMQAMKDEMVKIFFKELKVCHQS